MDKLRGFDIEAAAVDLLRHIGQGDERAFAELFRAVNRRIFLFAMHRLGNRHDAEEILSDTALQLWQHPDRFRGDSRFITYVLGIANNLASNLLRSRGRREEGAEGEIDEVADEDPTPFDALWRKEQLAAILRCMNELSKRQRVVVHLVHFEQMSAEEVGRIIACEANTVRQHLFQARRKMEPCLTASGLR